MTETAPTSQSVIQAQLLTSIKINRTVVLRLCLFILIPVLFFLAVTASRAGSSEFPDSEHAWESPFQTGINQSGAFLSAGNNILFLEGVTSETFKSLAFQSIFGGLLPGLILGSRPFVTNFLQYSYPFARTIQYNAYTLMTLAGYAPNYLFKALNLTNIVNAGAWYLIPSALSEFLYLADRASSNESLRDCPVLTRGFGAYIGLVLSQLGQALSGRIPSQIGVAGDDGFQLFIQINPTFTKASLTAIEIHRVQLASASESPSSTLLGQLAKAMDTAKASTLFLIPQTTTTGNHLNLSFAAKNESGKTQAITGSVALNFRDNRFTPWLETSLYNDSSRSEESEVEPPRISVFQKDILKPVIEFLECFDNETCSTGNMEPATPEDQANLVYTPYLNWITRQTVRDKQESEKNISLFSIPGGLFLKSAPGELTLSAAPKPLKTITQLWIPSWVTSAAVAEITSAARDSTMGAVHSALTKIAENNFIDTRAPWIRDEERQRLHETYNSYSSANRERLEDERYGRHDERRRLQRMQEEVAEERREARRYSEAQDHKIDRLREQLAAERRNRRTLNNKEILQWLMVDNDIDINQAISETSLTPDQAIRFRQIILASSNFHPGKVMMMKQGMRNEILPEALKTRLDEYRNLRTEPTAPVGYAAFSDVRWEGHRQRPIDAYESNSHLYAGGVMVNLPKYAEPNSECLICLEGSTTHPLFGCGREKCTARMHLHCLDRHFRADRIMHGRNAIDTTQCPQCRFPIGGQSYWY